jgi:hypothetical protein
VSGFGPGRCAFGNDGVARRLSFDVMEGRVAHSHDFASAYKQRRLFALD